MILSRFWMIIILVSISYLLVQLVDGSAYSLDYVINGKKDDPIIKKELYPTELPSDVLESLKKSKDHRLSTLKGDTLYILENQTVKLAVGKQAADGLLPTCKSSLLDLLLPLVAYLTFFCGILQLLIDSGASEKIATWLGPFFVKVFPEIPSNHPAIAYMMLNFAANFLGLDSAATPFGLKAMESLQELNPDKSSASNPQIMFMCLHAAGLTLIPTSIIGYRAAQNAQNPADVMLPCIITSFVGTLAAMLIVGIKQRISFANKTIILVLFAIGGWIAGLLAYITHLGIIEKNHFTGNISTLILLLIIFCIVGYSFLRENHFDKQDKTIFSSFVEGASSGLKTGKKIFPYILGMLAAISLFRNSGAFEIVSVMLTKVFTLVGINSSVVNALPVALLRPFNAAGSRGFMLDSMKTYGVDSLTGRLACIFQCASETTFYVIAVYFGSIKIKDTRYTLGAMLLVDLVCVITAILLALLFF